MDSSRERDTDQQSQSGWFARRAEDGPFACRSRLLRVARDTWSTSYSRLGRALLESGQFDDALLSMYRSADIAPHRARAWVNLGVALFDTGRGRAADEALRRAISVDPLDAISWTYLVRFNIARRDFKTARKVFNLMRQNGAKSASIAKLAKEIKRAELDY